MYVSLWDGSDQIPIQIVNMQLLELIQLNKQQLFSYMGTASQEEGVS